MNPEIRESITRANLTTREIADRCSVSQRQVQNWLAEKTPIPQLALDAILAMVAEREVLAPDQDKTRECLEVIASEQERRIDALERELATERAALEETRRRIENGT